MIKINNIKFYFIPLHGTINSPVKKNWLVYISLMISTFLSAFVLGMIQFYILEHLIAIRGEESREWMIQLVSAVITIGSVLVYIISGPLAAAVKKDGLWQEVYG